MKKYAYIFILVAVAAVLFWYSARFQENFYRAVEFLKNQATAKPITAVLLFMGLAAVSAALSPFSSFPLVPPAILIWGEELTFSLLLSGWLLGGAGTYLFGYYGAHPVLRKFMDIESRVKFYQNKISRKAEFWLIFLFRLAMPAEIPGYVLGSIRYNFFKYFLATFISESVFGLVIIYGSEAIMERRLDVLAALAGFILVVFLVSFYFFSRALRGLKTP